MNGYLICVSRNGWIIVVNVYTMNLLKKVRAGLDEIVHVQVAKSQDVIQLTMFDKHGKIQVWSTAQANLLIDQDARPGLAAPASGRGKTAVKKVHKQVS